MKNYRFILDKKGRKHTCPSCGKKRFVHFVDKKTNEFLPEQYGRCDRENKCGYYSSPYSDGYSQMIWDKECQEKRGFYPETKNNSSFKGNKFRSVDKLSIEQKTFVEDTVEKIVFFDFETFKRTLKDYDKNIFIQNLLSNIPFPFPADDIKKVIELYRLGTISNGYRSGAITFPFIDISGHVRTIQVKLFDNFNHTTGTDFLHSMLEKHHTRNNKPLPGWLELYLNQEKRVSCLFGAHLLNKYPSNPIALVEAPKTAIYGALYFGFPETHKNLIWLAVYNKSSFSIDKLKDLKGRFIFVFPDLSKDGTTFKEWKEKAERFEAQLPGTKFVFSNLLERLGPETDRANGNDLADFLIKLDWQKFRKTITIPIKSKHPKPTPNSTPQLKPQPTQEPAQPPTEDWTAEINELEAFFDNTKLPTGTVPAEQGEVITDSKKFVDSHLTFVKRNNGNPTYLPYLQRLQNFKNYLI